MRAIPVFVLLAVSAMGAAARAEADVASTVDDPTVDVRAFGGGGSGLGVDAWLPGRRVRVDVDAETYLPHSFAWAGAGAVLPVAGGGRKFLGLRAGYQLEYTGTPSDTWRGSRYAHAADAGVVVHLESTGGTVFEGAVGVEEVFRADAAVCCDNAALATASTGLRVAVRGELPLSHAWALFGQAGLRTADHLQEIKVLPTVALGVRVRL